MNNTDFFNTHRAEALKLIAEYVLPNHRIEVIASAVYNDDSEYCVINSILEFNPCTTTTEGKAQHIDMQDAYRKLLVNRYKDGLRDEISGCYVMKVQDFWKSTESPAALCIAMLDLIRKED